MNLLSVMLMILFPLGPALRIYELVRWFLGQVLTGFEDPAYVAELEMDRHELARLNRWLCDMQAMLHFVIGYLAREKLGLPFRDHRSFRIGKRAQERTGKPLSVAQVFARFERLVAMLGDIEALALRRAARIGQEIEANPLGLVDPIPAQAAPLAPLVLIACLPAAEAAIPHGRRIRAPP